MQTHWAELHPDLKITSTALGHYNHERSILFHSVSFVLIDLLQPDTD